MAATEMDRSRVGSDDADAPPSSSAGTSAPKQKSTLVLAAERAGRPSFSGYLRKLNSQQQWQKRYFEVIGGRYWVYRKSSSPSAEILCAMDLWKSGSPLLLDVGAHGDSVFSIEWDRVRLFRAANREEAQTWVRQMRMAQANRPKDMAPPVPAGVPAFSTVGGVLHVASASAGVAGSTGVVSASAPKSLLPAPAGATAVAGDSRAEGGGVKGPSAVQPPSIASAGAGQAPVDWGAARPPRSSAGKAESSPSASCCIVM
jgi:hypothetical protein